MSIEILTKKERKQLLEKYELTVKDIRLLERRGYVASYEIMREVRNMFPHHRKNRDTVYTDDYLSWEKQKYSEKIINA